MQNFHLQVELQVDCHQMEPSPLAQEIYAAIQELNNVKAVGTYEIRAEFLKMLDGAPLEKLIELCKRIYETNVSPQDFTKIGMIIISRRQMQLNVQTTGLSF